MTDRRQGPSPKDERDARLKAALKSNIARRKARAQAVHDDSTGDTPSDLSGGLNAVPPPVSPKED